jgi:hypothetical protein
MITRFFCFPDMMTAFTLAAAAGMTYTDEDGEERFIAYSHEWACDVLGEIDGYAGWHVNIRTAKDVPADFLQYEVFPEVPARDFA